MPSLTFYCQRMDADIDVHMCSQIIVDTQERAEIGVCLLCEHGATLAEHCPFYERHETLREETRGMGQKLLDNGGMSSCVAITESRIRSAQTETNDSAECPPEEQEYLIAQGTTGEQRKKTAEEDAHVCIEEPEETKSLDAADYLAIALSWAIRTYPWGKTHSWLWLISVAEGFGFDGTEKQITDAAKDAELTFITMKNRKALVVDDSAKAFARKASQ